MNADFEKQLQGQPLRELPREWRDEILAEANGARPSGVRSPGAVMAHSWLVGRDSVEPKLDLPGKSHGSTESRPTLSATADGLPVQAVSTWPSLRAWAGLAAVWVVIFALHLTAPDEPRLARSSSSATMMSFTRMNEQTLMMAQLLGQPDQADAGEAPAALPAPPKPRSEIARKQLVG
jgi:hypothetical protein